MLLKNKKGPKWRHVNSCSFCRYKINFNDLIFGQLEKHFLNNYVSRSEKHRYQQKQGDHTTIMAYSCTAFMEVGMELYHSYICEAFNGIQDKV